jgi:hypothetical protein
MSVSLVAVCVCAVVAAAPEVGIAIDTSRDVKPISPCVYGSNAHGGDEAANVGAVRWGGNRTTGYNWETNYSSAGADWQHFNDDFLLQGVPENQWRVPAVVMTRFHQRARALGVPDLITLQMAGYVAGDNRRTVSEAETAPSPRWCRAEFRKNAPFTLTPDTTDGVVYMDECVNYLVTKLGPAAEGGVQMYSLDNEPAIWRGTHARIHPKPLKCDELIERSAALSSAVKDVDPTAKIVGGAFYGWSAFESLQGDESGWPAYSDEYGGWFINFYLDRMKRAGEAQGRRLLDVLDVHWYPEVRVNNVRITSDQPVGDRATMIARANATRSLWQADYEEQSWIGQWRRPVRLIGRLKDGIEQYYPGTGICFGEYNYGGSRDVSGALAQADFLGVCGREGVYMACHWGSLQGFTLAGYQIWRNYDGRDSTFGDTSVTAVTADPNDTSAYASLGEEGAVHIILINRKFDEPVTFNLSITHDRALTTGQAWFVDGTRPAVQRGGEIAGIEGNRLTYTAPPFTVHHLVLR